MMNATTRNPVASRNNNLLNANARNPDAKRDHFHTTGMSIDDSTNLDKSKFPNTQSNFGGSSNLTPAKARPNFGKRGNAIVGAYGVGAKIMAKQNSGSKGNLNVDLPNLNPKKSKFGQNANQTAKTNFADLPKIR